jgi:superoxide reductase
MRMATKKLQIWKCEICGNIVELLHAGPGELVCCGQPMKLMVEQTADFTTEKHVPIINEVENGVLVVVGSTPHPMKPEHYIEWIEVHTDDAEYRQYLEPGAPPEAFFPIGKDSIVMAREYCNVHHLWKS